MTALLASVALAGSIIELGDSNANSTRVDTTWGGVAVQPGWVYVHNGASSSTWPSGNAPGVGKLPYLVGLVAQEEGCVIRRAANGARANALGNQLAGAVLDVATFECADPFLVVLTVGVNDGRPTPGPDPTVWASAYGGYVAETIADIGWLWPSALVVVAREDVSDAAASSTHPYVRSLVYTAQEGLGVPWVDGTVCDRVDAVHWSTAGTGGGQQCVAELVWSVLP